MGLHSRPSVDCLEHSAYSRLAGNHQMINTALCMGNTRKATITTSNSCFSGTWEGTEATRFNLGSHNITL